MKKQNSLLIVDDDASLNRSFALILKKTGYVVDAADTGAEAITKIKKTNYDLIILDVKLPDVRGVDLIPQIKRICPDLVVIIATAFATLNMAVYALNNGASAFLIKPFNIDAALATIRETLEKQRLIFENRRLYGELEVLSMFSSANPDPVLRLSPSGEILYANEASQALLEAIGCRKGGLSPKTWQNHLRHVLKEKKPLEADVQAKRRIYAVQFMPVPDGSSIYVCGRDVTEKRDTEERLQVAASVFKNSTEGIMVTDLDGVILDVNEAFTTITGFSKEETIGQKPNLLRSNQHDETFYAKMWHKLLNEGTWEGEIYNRRKNGELYPEWITISAIKDPTGKTIQFASIFFDITDLKQREEQILHQAYHDILTGLPNRLLFSDRFSHAIKKAKRLSLRVGVMFIDLDNFKGINDRLGHAEGDKLLQEVASRLAGCLREEDTVARHGGDEFMILMEKIEEYGSLEEMARRIQTAFMVPIQLEGKDFTITASIGIAIFPSNGQDAETLVKNADKAMYEAKKSGKNKYKFF